MSMENHKIHINSADKERRVCGKCEFIYVYKLKVKLSMHRSGRVLRASDS